MNRALFLPKPWFWIAVAALLISVLSSTAQCAGQENIIINIGVLSGETPDACRKRWQATATYLSAEIPGYRFVIQPISESQLHHTVGENSVQFLIVNPYNFVELAQIYHIQPVLTLKRLRGDRAYSRIGSVIFSRRDDHRIRSLDDLVGKTFMAVSETSFAGWRNVRDTLHQHGIAPGFDFTQVVFGHTHQAVVMAVRDGLTAAGAVAAGTLESMAAQGDIALDSFRILNPIGSQDDAFPFLRSTRLFPEWPLAVLPNVSRKLTEKVARSLLALAPDSDAAKTADLAGWTPALNYQPVHEAMTRLKQHAPSTTLLPRSIGLHALIFFAVLTSCFGGAIWYYQGKSNHCRFQSASCSPNNDSRNQPGSQIALPSTRSGSETQKAANAYECLEKLRCMPLFNATLTALILASPRSQRVVAVNNKACKLLKRSEDQIIGKLCQDLGISCTPTGTRIENLAGDTSASLNRPLAVKTHIAPITVEDTEFLLVSFIDTTDLIEIRQQLKEAKATADAAQTAKGQFLANMNHEIRTPLNGIVSMVELLIQSNLPEEHLEYVTIIQQSAKALVSIVDDVMDYYKIETGGIKIDLTNAELAGIVTNTAQAYSRIAQAKGVGFSCVIDPNLPKWIHCDPIRLRQVLDILLNNAVKFTQKGTIHLHVDLEGRHENKVTARFQIGDSGIGIHSDQLETLFDSFSQGVGSAVQKPGGIGLGLTISKKLVELMDGKIQVESEPGQGTRFWFCLDFEIAKIDSQLLHEAGPSPAAIESESASHNILLVEDNQVNQKVATKILTKSGYKVDIAENGRLAFASLAKNCYDLILMDIQMPEMDGLEATRRIRNAEAGKQNKDLPIIAVTANAMNTDRQQCLDCGMNDYLTKPINASKLLELIDHWLPTNQHLRDRQDVSGNTSAKTKASCSLDLAKATERALGDSDFVHSLLEEFISQSPANMEKLRHANHTGNIEAIKYIAHSLKGAAASLNATALASAAYDLENIPDRLSSDKREQLIHTLDNEFRRLEAFFKHCNFPCTALELDLCVRTIKIGSSLLP